MGITLRLARDIDEEFLFSVYTSTRTEEMASVNWNIMQKESFLRMQFRLQSQYYKENYPDAHYQIIMLDDQPVGRLYVQRRNDEIRIMDIALLTEFRGRGIGSNLLNKVFAEATQNNLPVTIHVERFNPALHLYARLGFCLVEDKGVYYFMKWLPIILKEQNEYTG